MTMKYKKYPRTPHLDISPGKNRNDIVLETSKLFLDKKIVVTEKMDGECTGMTRDTCHARSLDSQDHESRHWVKSLHSTICHDIPVGWKIFGENLYAKHTIKYENLKSYFLVFSIWTDEQKCLSWENTKAWAKERSLATVDELYNDICHNKTLTMLAKQIERKEKCEGFVVRTADSFHYDVFGINVAKWVRKNFVQTDQHWKFGEIVKNKMLK